ncbi:MAG: RsmD family RNA methyltransferase, partial [Myxococcota bacterium]|nr:RsmD family RNA methyltransferase [Myxococcota bacterium]
RDPRAIAACRRNAAAVPELASAIRIARADAPGFLRRADPALPADLVFLDPPYAFDRWEALLEALAACGAVRPGGIVVCERSARAAHVKRPGFRTERSARYGDTAVDLLVAEARR